MPAGGDPGDLQARYIEAAVNGIIIGCIYLPNGNPQPGPKFDYKLAWFKRLLTHARVLRNAKVPVVLAGDYNVVPTAFDIYKTHSYDNDARVHPEIRRLYELLLRQGWTDALRQLNPNDQSLPIGLICETDGHATRAYAWIISSSAEIFCRR